MVEPVDISLCCQGTDRSEWTLCHPSIILFTDFVMKVTLQQVTVEAAKHFRG